MISDYYVYVLLDSSKKGDYVYSKYTFEYEPFYIGKGRGKRIKDTLYDHSPFKRNKISKLKRNGIEIISLKIKEGLSNEEAIFNEIELISIVGRRDLKKGPLVNNTDGGDGRINSFHSDEVKEKISKSRKGKAVGWKHSEETLKIMSDNQKGEKNGFYGKKHSLKTKKEQSERVSGLSHPMFGKKHNKETIDVLIKHRKENISNEKIKEACQKFNKSVLMYDLELNFISEFKSVKEASENTGINESIISKCCRGDIKSPTRYFFKYKNKEDNVKKNKFLLTIGDYFDYKNETFKLIKRNKRTCICESLGGLITIHYDDCEILKKKELIF
jgi:group I intron endonuclease